MEKKDELPDNPQTMEDYVLSQLKQTVILKSGDTLKAAIKREQCQTCLSIAEREQVRAKRNQPSTEQVVDIDTLRQDTHEFWKDPKNFETEH